MLHFKTVEPYTLSVLRQLMELPELQDFSLVGGTALSLLYGHRLSVGLDMFSNKAFENADIITALKTTFSDKFIHEEKQARFGIFCYVDNVKIDIIRHPHPLIRPETNVENIRMFSTEDIIAMKIQAILGRGKKRIFGILLSCCNIFLWLILQGFTKKNMQHKIY